MNKKNIIKYIPNAIVAFILLQTLFFKFTGHAQSVELFTQLNLFGLDESFGRIGTGIAELLVGIGLFIPKTMKMAALGAIALMVGALYFHATELGFEGANLQLAIMAVVALAGGIYIFRRKKERKITVIEA